MTFTPRPPVGAHLQPGGVSYRVWAPDRRTVRVAIGGSAAPLRFVELHRDGQGFFSGADSAGAAGDLYRFHLDDRLFLPDPVSRHQPFGVFGPSRVVDPERYVWRETGWRRPPLRGRVLYELHVGTFTPEGTFAAAVDRLDALAELGVNTIELMPVADFPGRWNWGYDGVMLYAPARCYGSPDDLRALVDAAHARGLATVLDVVYNHLGPTANHLERYARDYFHPERRNAWGRALNFDGPDSRHVRDFFVQNAAYWLDEFRFDGLRLDSVHSIIDESPVHLLAEISELAHARGAFVIGEDERNLAQVITPVEAGGLGLDAVWSDDFHHAVRVALTGQQESHFGSYRGMAVEIAEALAHGWFFRGQLFPHWGRSRGTDASHRPPESFVVCISNHDQVGNRALGDRLHAGLRPASYRAVSMLLCLAPATPLLFMGQEWAAATPFLFFSDHPGDVGENMAENRLSEFKNYGVEVEPEVREQIPDPQEAGTFFASKLNWRECDEPAHACMRAFYCECLGLRSRETIFQSAPRTCWEARALGPAVVALRWREEAGDWLLLVDFTSEGEAVVPEEDFIRASGGRRWRIRLASNEGRFGGTDETEPVWMDEAGFHLLAPGAVLLRES
jgi:maltooligosyltrehalose trehalohydrolase